MTILYLVLGVLFLFVVITDFLWTTLWVEGGAGPLTSRLMVWTWGLVRRAGDRNSQLLTVSGPLILIFGLASWIVFLWAGWTLLFASAENVLIDTVDARRISWSELIYYTGYTIFTLGNGDFIPQDSLWQITTTLASATGMLFITLSVTYVLSVLGAVTQKRSFAANVSGLGTQSTELLGTSWDGSTFRGLETPLNTIATQLNTLTANHKAYPILHYFHSKRTTQAPTTSIATLDEALTLLQFGVAEQDRPDELRIMQVRSSIQNYLKIVGSTYVEPADRSPPPPEIATLREMGIPTVSDEEFTSSITELDERRRTLLGLIESDERQWPASDRT
ncbi:potassium channel family protein [Halocatena pleomorpha]|uniref:Two pore domain potassium channel family protein n=1 Tax=Halocatena pleomorpha TaxID=1785090 RepID=A0A3P3R9N4_9EURY|nr:potassium channel family protein [Halocatena pleomorpha]RRJ29390.1 two pore domain potassium channel family protein [Halocatena pleomorpha]